MNVAGFLLLLFVGILGYALGCVVTWLLFYRNRWVMFKMVESWLWEDTLAELRSVAREDNADAVR